jgi:hypothetical protein
LKIHKLLLGPPSPLGIIELNFDVAIRDNFSIIVVVGLDFDGSLIFFGNKCLPLCDQDMGEALAAMLARSSDIDLKINTY